MTTNLLVIVSQALFLGYFLAVNIAYLALNAVALWTLRRYLAAHSLADLPRTYSGFETPVSVLVPAYNEHATITASVSSMLQLDYPEFEVIVINDGSTDGTLDVLRRDFDLVEVVFDYWAQVPSSAVRGFYRSRVRPNLLVIDKENGGKADALNAGINASRFPLICCVDADSILARNSLGRAVEPFLEDPTTIAAGGTIRVANGSVVRGGFLESVDLPRRFLPLMQVLEYLRAFLFGRLGWSPMNAVLIISGAFGVFKKDKIIAAGGYRRDTLGEDMEIVVRLHRINRLQRQPYRIRFVADPICWTEAPETLSGLRTQRVRWQRGLVESLMMNRALLLHPRGGTVGWLAFPFMVIFECFGPVLEVCGYVFMIGGFALGLVSYNAFLAFLILAIGLGILLSMNGLLLEEMSFQTYRRPAHVPALLFAAVLENFGYRQLNTVWRLWGLASWATRRKSSWGTLQRTAEWQREL